MADEVYDGAVGIDLGTLEFSYTLGISRLVASCAILLTFCPSGTTYSCVAIYEGTNVEIIANEQGSFTTPSFVSFTDEERLIGEAAKNQAAMNPRNTVFDVK